MKPENVGWPFSAEEVVVVVDGVDDAAVLLCSNGFERLENAPQSNWNPPVGFVVVAVVVVAVAVVVVGATDVGVGATVGGADALSSVVGVAFWVNEAKVTESPL